MKLPTPLLILLGVIGALAISVYWQFNGAKMEFANFDPQIPGAQKLSLSGPNIPGMAATGADPYKQFTGGALAFKYPSTFQGAENLLGQEAVDQLKLNNSSFFVYRVAVPDLQPAYIMVSESSATSTAEIAEQVKQAFDRQQCAIDIKSATSTNAAIFEMLDAGYECSGAQKEFSQWRAQTAIVKKAAGFYTISAITTAKNWPNLQIEARAIFDSITVNFPEPAGGATTTIENASSSEPQN